MNLALLNIAASEAVLDILAEEFLSTPTTRHKVGQEYAFGRRVHKESGISVAISDANTSAQLIEEVEVFFGSMSPVAENNLPKATGRELSVGFSVGDTEQFVGSVSFSPELMAKLAKCGIVLSVTAYPTSDEANAI